VNGTEARQKNGRAHTHLMRTRHVAYRFQHFSPKPTAMGKLVPASHGRATTQSDSLHESRRSQSLFPRGGCMDCEMGGSTLQHDYGTATYEINCAYLTVL
jgi:hypothetical protein